MRHFQQQAYGRLRVEIPSHEGHHDPGIQTAPSRFRLNTGIATSANEADGSLDDTAYTDDDPICRDMRFASEDARRLYNQRLKSLCLSLPSHRLCRTSDDFLQEAALLSDSRDVRWERLLRQLSIQNPLFVETLSSLVNSLRVCRSATDDIRMESQISSHTQSPIDSSIDPSSSSTTSSTTISSSNIETTEKDRCDATLSNNTEYLASTITSSSTSAPAPASDSTNSAESPHLVFLEGRNEKIRYRDTAPYAFNHVAHMGSWIRPGVAAIQWPLLSNLTDFYTTVLQAKVHHVIALGPLVDVAYWRSDLIKDHVPQIHRVDGLQETPPACSPKASPTAANQNHNQNQTKSQTQNPNHIVHAHHIVDSGPNSCEDVASPMSCRSTDLCAASGSSYGEEDADLEVNLRSTPVACPLKSKPSKCRSPLATTSVIYDESNTTPPSSMIVNPADDQQRISPTDETNTASSLHDKDADAVSQTPSLPTNSSTDPDTDTDDGFQPHPLYEGVLHRTYLLNGHHKLYVYRMPYWDDFDVPHESLLCSVVEMAAILRSCHEANGALVHCKAGVGRTGTILLLAAAWQTWEKHGAVDIYFELLKLRLRRPRMVQSKEQLRYVFLAMDHIVRNDLRMTSAKPQQ
eukprot:TRINITY_DN673_c0_g5_i1.p1 TRINITY_DN673_c0_g5~~TRINITY_DN673_c0_g5_i1.p1  ORF type:complete len:633 (-),score=136.84 TRINITY_DN673_c0_g5_i1:915-2813(-)